jgi:hypothetical protein
MINGYNEKLQQTDVCLLCSCEVTYDLPEQI